jgi:hypothetical protein
MGRGYFQTESKIKHLVEDFCGKQFDLDQEIIQDSTDVKRNFLITGRYDLLFVHC